MSLPLKLAIADNDLTPEDLESLLDELPSLQTLVLEECELLETYNVSCSCLCPEHM